MRELEHDRFDVAKAKLAGDGKRSGDVGPWRRPFSQ